MDEFDTDRLRIKQIVLDGVQYEIAVSEFTFGFHRATWTCTDCSEEGAFAPVSADARHAIALAKVCIQLHHGLLHQRGAYRRVTLNRRSQMISPSPTAISVVAFRSVRRLKHRFHRIHGQLRIGRIVDRITDGESRPRIMMEVYCAS